MKKNLKLILVGSVACASTCILTLGAISLKNHETNPTPTPTVESVPAEKFDAEKNTFVSVEQRSFNTGSKRVSWYGQDYCDKHNPSCITASGEKFDESALTAACADSIPLGANLKFTWVGKAGEVKEVVVRCNDRGAFEGMGRVADLSKASFEALAPLSVGVLQVEMEVLK